MNTVKLVTMLAIPLLLLLRLLAVAQQPQPTLDQTLEKEGCATLEQRNVRICKYDYSADGKKVEAFTIRPLADGKYPGLVLLYGREGARTSFNLAAIFAQQGFACVAISELGYGKSEGKPDFMGPASIDAFGVGFEKFKREPFVDGEKMGVFGYSRGGRAAALLTLKLGKEVKAAVFAAGLYEFKRAYDETGLDGIRESMRTETGMTEQAIKERSPILRMEKLESPVLIIHGENDQNAPTNQSSMLRNRLTELKKEFEIIILVDHKHGQLKSNFISPVIDFFSRKLKGVPGSWR
jgi:dipeptidyl aminopeptidase/acylaminoacyl peptidase